MDGADGFCVLIKIVAHKTKQLAPAAQALSSDSDSAEAEQFLTTRALCTPLKVAKHLGCDVQDLIHLNTVRYPAISGPRIQLQQKTRLLKPFRSRTVQGLVVAHNGSDQNERFRLAALDPDRICHKSSNSYSSGVLIIVQFIFLLYSFLNIL